MSVEPFYCGYDQAGLEAQYNLRRSHPDRDAVYAEYAAKSAAYRACAPGRLDVRYGAAERQSLDIFPAGDGAPVLVFFHGGYWRALDKSIFSFLAEAFVAAGWTTVLPNYTLAPATDIDAIVDEARQAVRWVVEAQAGAGTPLVVAGHSAGGHLALMCVLADWRRYGLAPDVISGAITVSGIFDLEPLRHTTINDLVRLDAASARRNSPINLVRPSSAPVLLVAGGAETDDFRGQTMRFAAAWDGAGNRSEVCVPPGLDHFTVLRDVAGPKTELHRTIIRFLGTAAGDIA